MQSRISASCFFDVCWDAAQCKPNQPPQQIRRRGPSNALFLLFITIKLGSIETGGNWKLVQFTDSAEATGQPRIALAHLWSVAILIESHDRAPCVCGKQRRGPRIGENNEASRSHCDVCLTDSGSRRLEVGQFGSSWRKHNTQFDG